MGTTWGSADRDPFQTEAAETPTRVPWGDLCGWTSPPFRLTFLFALEEALKDEDEMEVVLRVAQRQHGDAAHA